MPDPVTFLGVGIGALGTGALTWLWRVYVHSDARRERRETKAAEVEQHREDLTLELLKAARADSQAARSEIEDVRAENRALQSLEQHFYHFEQALDHLEAILTADDEPARVVAERNARAFLLRMRRIQQAKGEIQQGIQIIESANRLESKE